MASIPHHQHALIQTAKGLVKEHFKIDEHFHVHKPAKGELLVHVKAAALNPVDWKMAHAGFLVKEYPLVLGCDLAGVVVSIGDGVSHFKVGDEVYAYTKLASHHQGAFQHYAIVEARMAAHRPKSISMAAAATLGVGSLTAADGLFLKGGLKWPGTNGHEQHDEWVLIWGGSSSVGAYAVQLAHLAGYQVIATASPKNFDYVKSLGAKHVVDYNSPNVIDEIKHHTHGKLHVAYDVISPDSAAKAAHALHHDHHGRIIYCAGEPKNIPSHVKSISIFIGANYEDPEYPSAVQKIAALVEQGKLKPNQVELLHGGLHGVVDGMIKLQKGVSAVKLVAEL